MAISELLPLGARKKVVWFGTGPPDPGKSAFEERDFVVASYTDRDLQIRGNLAGIAAVVFTQSDAQPLEIARDLKKHAIQLLDYDCRIIIRPAPKALPILTKAVDELHLPTAGLPLQEARKLMAWQLTDGDPPLPHAHVFEELVSWSKIANFVADHPPGKDPSYDLAIEGNRPKAFDLLIRRAFADCKEVQLVPMGGGHSGVAVYRAYAELPGGGWPVPYFVKIGDRATVFTEYQNYGLVAPYVPYHLGPHLVSERCCLGMRYGLIVGDYVEESESLLRCASDGRAMPAIACLFDRTLRGWHRLAQTDSRPLSEILRYEFPRKIANHRFARSRELGAVRDLGELRSLFECCLSTPVRVGPIHGDLHATNVCVRTTDAIVIDFYQHRSGPLVYDAACLEASLLVDGFTEVKKSKIDKWLQSIKTLYDYVSQDSIPAHANPKNPSFWFHSSVRQIRRYAREMEAGPGQYAAALAVALLRKASKDSDAAEPEASRRAVAYVLAERVLSTTFQLKVKPS